MYASSTCGFYLVALVWFPSQPFNHLPIPFKLNGAAPLLVLELAIISHRGPRLPVELLPRAALAARLVLASTDAKLGPPRSAVFIPLAAALLTDFPPRNKWRGQAGGPWWCPAFPFWRRSVLLWQRAGHSRGQRWSVRVEGEWSERPLKRWGERHWGSHSQGGGGGCGLGGQSWSSGHQGAGLSLSRMSGCSI